MEKFFMIVTFLLTNPTSVDRPLYVFAEPWFKSHNECVQFVKENNLRLYNTAIASYNLRYKPEAIYCLQEKAVKDIFEYNYGNKAKEIQS